MRKTGTTHPIPTRSYPNFHAAPVFLDNPKWTTIAATIEIPVRAFADAKKRGMIDLITQKTFCAKHVMQYDTEAPFIGAYRRYRRGKNRCLGCGVKI